MLKQLKKFGFFASNNEIPKFNLEVPQAKFSETHPDVKRGKLLHRRNHREADKETSHRHRNKAKKVPLEQQQGAPWILFNEDGYLVKPKTPKEHRNRHQQQGSAARRHPGYDKPHDKKESFHISPDEIAKYRKEASSSKPRSNKYPASHSFDDTIKIKGKLDNISSFNNRSTDNLLREHKKHRKHHEPSQIKVVSKEVQRPKATDNSLVTPLKTFFIIDKKTVSEDVNFKSFKKCRNNDNKKDGVIYIPFPSSSSGTERTDDQLKDTEIKTNKKKESATKKVADNNLETLKKIEKILQDQSEIDKQLKSKKKKYLTSENEHKAIVQPTIIYKRESSNPAQVKKKKKQPMDIAMENTQRIINYDNNMEDDLIKNDKSKDGDVITKTKKIKKRKDSVTEKPLETNLDILKKIEKLLQDQNDTELKNKKKKHLPTENEHCTIEHPESGNNPAEIKTKNREPLDIPKEETPMTINNLEDELVKMKSVQTTNFQQAKKSFVQTNLSVVNIECPERTLDEGNLLERKKQSFIFQKYYRYIKNAGSREGSVSTCNDQSLSDSNRMCLDCSDQSESSLKNIIKKKKNRRSKTPELITSTHFHTIESTVRLESGDKKFSKSKFGICRSKIPVPHSNNKIVASSKAETEEPKIFNSNQQETVSIEELSPTTAKTVPKVVPNTNKKIVVSRKVSKVAETDERKQNNGLKEFVKKSCSKILGNQQESNQRINLSSGNKDKVYKTNASKAKDVKTKVSGEKNCSAASSKIINVSSKEVKRAPVKKVTKEVLTSAEAVAKNVKNETKQTKNTKNQKNFESVEKKIEKSTGSRAKIRNVSSPSTVGAPLKTVNSSKNPPCKKSMPTPPNSKPASKSNIKKRPKSPPSTYRKSSDEVVIKTGKPVIAACKSTSQKLSSTNSENLKPAGNQIETSSTRTSFSNSTAVSLEGRSTDSAKTPTSLLLTKHYNDQDKLDLWKKKKMYADLVRQKLLTKHQNQPQQVMEVRFLTVELDEAVTSSQDSCKIEEVFDEENVEKLKESCEDFFKNDLPNHSVRAIEAVSAEKFCELFESTLDGALEDIMHENYNFLKKDFTFRPCKKFTSRDASSDRTLEDDWYEFEAADSDEIFDEIYLNNEYATNKNPITLDSIDLTDSISAPGSEESGFCSAIKSATFFERPEIQALMKSSPLDSCTVPSCQSSQTQTETSQISEKSVQIKMSKECLHATTVAADCASQDNVVNSSLRACEGATLLSPVLKDELQLHATTVVADCAVQDNSSLSACQSATLLSPVLKDLQFHATTVVSDCAVQDNSSLRACESATVPSPVLKDLKLHATTVVSDCAVQDNSSLRACEGATVPSPALKDLKLHATTVVADCAAQDNSSLRACEGATVLSPVINDLQPMMSGFKCLAEGKCKKQPWYCRVVHVFRKKKKKCSSRMAFLCINDK